MSEKKIGWKFDNTYLKLSNNLFSRQSPLPVKSPKIILFNNDLSKELNLNCSKINSKEMALIFSGN